MKNQELNLAIYLSIPTVIAYGTLGFVFGVLFTHADFGWYWAPVMSAVVYAGAVQFVALSMMMEHSSLLATLVATFFIGLRNAFYGLSVHRRFDGAKPLTKLFLIFGLVDANFAIFSIKARQPNDINFCFYLTFIMYLSWVLGTLLGALLADFIPELKGMDFVLTSFFMVLVIEYYLLHRKIDALILPIPTAMLAYWMAPQYYLLIAIVLSAFYLYLKVRVTS